MAKARAYPGADRSRFYGSKYAGATFTGLEKILLHSTETSAKWGCPGYSSGSMAPTLTIDPWNKKVWQHFDLNESARALVNPASTAVSENKDNVCQIEIIGYSDPKIAATYGYFLDDLPDDALDYIAGVIALIAREWDVPLVRPALWPLYPASYGNSPARMSSTQYDRFTGVLGHLHASGNTHGDPRLPQIDRILAKAAAINGAKATGPGVYPGTALRRGTTGPKVVELQAALGVTADGSYGPGTEAAVRAHQTAAGLQVDGITGPATWASIFQEDDDMQLTDKIGFFKAPDVTYSTDSTTVAGILASTNYYVLQTRNRLETQIAALTAAVTTLANSQGLDPNLIQKILSDAVDTALSDLKIVRNEES